jgi:protein-glutamine gamma-glutamyltransferase
MATGGSARRRVSRAPWRCRRPPWRRIRFREAIPSGCTACTGTPLAIKGLDGVIATSDGTALTGDKPLSEGDSYLATAYVPNPSEAELRAAEGQYDPRLASYTQLAIPGPPTIENAGPSALRPATTVQLPFRGRGSPSPETEAALEASPYGDAYRLATELASGAPTTFDAVNAIQDHLAGGYAYSENPPQSEYPLASFLFEDRIGYCQQFSGAMALMLRMVGIPARVASGFAPGSPDLDEDSVFQVEDLDAHSWVEVYFSGIGWVSFDPTPAASPAAGEFVDAAGAGAERGRLAEPEIRGGVLEESVRARRNADDSGGGSALWVLGAVALAIGAVAAVAICLRAARFRRLGPAGAVEAQVAELRGGLGRMGWPVRNGETLRALEGRLRRAGKPKSAGYLQGLRRRRYSGDGSAPPTLAARRELRRELTRTRGLRARLQGLVALPPGGPR